MKILSKDWAFLVNVSDDIEADIVISLLQSHEIQARKHYPSAGIFSKTIVGTVKNVDIYVDEIMFKKAKDIISNFVE